MVDALAGLLVVCDGDGVMVARRPQDNKLGFLARPKVYQAIQLQLFEFLIHALCSLSCLHPAQDMSLISLIS
jgi:hypothetical protein